MQNAKELDAVRDCSNCTPASRCPDHRSPYYFTQATRIIRRFGSVNRLVAALCRAGHPYTRRGVQWWNYRNGLVPSSAVRAVLEAAALEGIILTAADWDPHWDKQPAANRAASATTPDPQAEELL